MQELHSKIKPLPSVDPAAIKNGNATTTGAIIDTQGYEGLEFILQNGVITDGTLATAIFGSNDSGMAGEVQLTTSTGLMNADLATLITDDSKCFRQGVNIDVAGFRYYRQKITQAAATTGGFYCSIALLNNPKVMPVAAP
jgi:hypothetical protein